MTEVCKWFRLPVAIYGRAFHTDVTSFPLFQVSLGTILLFIFLFVDE